jgi:hypothetical protein
LNLFAILLETINTSSLTLKMKRHDQRRTEASGANGGYPAVVAGKACL